MACHDANVYLTGFMGVGKSTVGKALAQVLRRPFVDMDTRLAEVLGMPIAQAFETVGEAHFRRLEGELLEELSGQRGLVVATGGGVPVDAGNRARMRAGGSIVLLDGAPEKIAGRLSRGAVARRPLWRDADAVRALYESRREAYADCDLRLDALLPEIRDKVAAVLAHLIPETRLSLTLEGHPCDVVATVHGPSRVAGPAAGRRVAILTDRSVAQKHLARYVRELPGAVPIVVAPGESAKSLRHAEEVYRALLEARFERRDLLLALGGGVVTDLGGFVGATYKRGMDVVLASTSLLGCVDAAVGGKSAVNLADYKNQVGLFTVPALVVLDLEALATLPAEEIREGLVEAYKTGIALDPDLAAFIEEHFEDLSRGDLPAVAEVARVSARVKGRVVTADFREGGLRRVLNLGHTYGHAVETWHRCGVRHGQCVAAGLEVMTELSRARDLLPAAVCERILETLLRLDLRGFALPGVEEAWPIMRNDKKNVGGRVTFVLLRDLGDHLCVDDVTPAELGEALARVRARRGGPPAAHPGAARQP
ncbi:MAG: hypothetical protein JXR77_15540 [Lentisphaeria bacterium]|nr:hypothetical protein [Lentisphaeria bacterium]